MITLTPAGEFRNGLYVITLSETAKIKDLMGNEMAQTTLSIEIDTSIVPPVTLSFQQGINGYIGTVDTEVRGSNPDADLGLGASINVDGADGGFEVHGLLRFEDIFGSDSGQVPVDAQIISALLELQVTNPGNSFHLHRMLQTWSDEDSWNTWVSGVQPDNEEADEMPDASTGAVGTGTLSIDVTVSLATWQASPLTNYGWAMLMPPTSADGVDFNSSEGTIPPKLIVTFIITTGNQPPVAADDAYGVDEDNTLSVGAPGVLANDTDPESDPLSAVLDSDVSNGTLALNSSGSFTYTPNPDFSGTDSFTYKANDGIWNSNVATVTITVNPAVTVPGQATEPTPSEGQTRVNRNTVILSWLAGAGATSHDVYLGTELANLPLVSEGQSETTYDPPRLERQTKYYWRIDEVNAGTTTGVVWSFTTK